MEEVKKVPVKKVIKKIDWYVKDVFQKTFVSYEDAAEYFRKEYNDPKISNVTVSRLFNKNIKNTGEPSVIPKFKDIEFDIREHVYADLEKCNKRICTYCKVEKPFTEEFFYLNKTNRGKCKLCNTKRFGSKPKDDFKSILNDNWKFHDEYPNIYFERDTSQIFNIDTGKYLTNIRSFRNLTARSAIDIKWEIFVGDIPENKIVKNKEGTDGIQLNNLECVYIHCQDCNKVIKNPDLLSRYCSKNCQLKVKVTKERELRHNNINTYLSNKYSVQKNINKDIDYDIDYLVSLGTICSYCDVECTFGNSEYTSCGLSFDRKDSDIGYCKNNVVVSCWFCNVMKNTSDYDDWMQFINFVKDPEETILDLSNKTYSKDSRTIDSTTVYTNLKRDSPKHYPNSTDGKKVFLELCKDQGYKDPIFYFFPIIYLERNCLWNASIDAIDCTLPKEDKHRPDNLQIIPKIFNYGKHVHSQEQFVKEWKKRNFKTDFSKCKVIFPEGYIEHSYFHKMITK